MAKANLIRVLLVDDHVMVRQGLRNVLQAYPNIEVVGEAGNGEEAVSIIGKLHPAVVVMDIIMPKMDGIAATRLIRTNYPDIAVLGLSVTPHSYHIDAMIKAGAFEVLTKEKAVHELYSEIQRAVAAVQPIVILEDSRTPPMTTAAAKEAGNPSREKLPIKESDTPKGELGSKNQQ